MPTTRHDHGRARLEVDGPTLEVQIGFDRSFRHSQPSRPHLPDKLYPALIDTGADLSAVDLTLAQQLELPVVGQTNVAGVHGAYVLPEYLAQIHIPSLAFTIYGRFAGLLLSSGGQQHSALIGRAFLRSFTMIYEGRTGVVQLSND